MKKQDIVNVLLCAENDLDNGMNWEEVGADKKEARRSFRKVLNYFIDLGLVSEKEIEEGSISELA